MKLAVVMAWRQDITELLNDIALDYCSSLLAKLCADQSPVRYNGRGRVDGVAEAEIADYWSAPRFAVPAVPRAAAERLARRLEVAQTVDWDIAVK